MEKILKSAARTAGIAVGFLTALFGAFLFCTDGLPIVFFVIGTIMFLGGLALCCTFLPKRKEETSW